MDITSIKMDNVIKDIIVYSKNNRIEVTPEPLDVEQIINHAIEENMFNDSNLNLKLEVKHGFDKKRPQKEFFTDKLRLKILLKNLISNAINHRDINKEECKVKLECYGGVKNLTISITDNGVGIPEPIQKEIYDLFFIGNPKSQGSGIGLYIVKEILSKLNGKINLQSKVGEGTSFKIEIPEMKL